MSESGNYTNPKNSWIRWKDFTLWTIEWKGTRQCVKKLERNWWEATGYWRSTWNVLSQSAQSGKWSKIQMVNVTEMKDYNELTWECGPVMGTDKATRRWKWPWNPGRRWFSDADTWLIDVPYFPGDTGRSDEESSVQPYSKASIENMFQGAKGEQRLSGFWVSWNCVEGPFDQRREIGAETGADFWAILSK